MDKAKRQIYRDVLDIGGYGLCNICRYAAWSGSCCESYLECEHPLPVVSEPGIGHDPDEVWMGADCWAFRLQKSMTLSDVAAISSIAASGAHPHRNKRGEWVALTGVEI